ncbi:S-adenosyl-L-methionine-dependent methyltransferase [Pseudomassariella vexata]|uniref:S-adenosyl-L-methionine-dependent methyltransferase n=1 Tax=Pseudomassariella vexata TaxID=1141098 RepID=A0A1Y2DAT0_9PEZI|nr:S-adenosyl-L-methionine-dependent methyltransferase [Pseudomassariella vexata]ORY56381.1 S-adenosyl-L-methionine-dependent methyltransferase [Pseudomassariella vexata]
MQQEQQRLELQHYIYKVALGGRLHLAPVENPNRVIDIGTGTGVWAVEFADSNPQSDVLGTDLSPMQSSYTAPNCRFEIDDIEDDWIFNHKFDYIHGRSISTHMRNVPRLCAAMLNNLNPGGWAELQDVIAEFKTFDRTIEGTALQQWNRLMVEGVRNLGRDMRAARSNKRRMEEAGFQNIVEHRLPIPVNHWPRGAQHKNLGRDQMRSALDGIQAPTIQVLSKGLGWSREEAEVFLINVRKEIQNPHIHSYFEMIVVFGQKLPR